MNEQTSCCVVGAGPAGVVLALLLARKGVDVTLLELHKDLGCKRPHGLAQGRHIACDNPTGGSSTTSRTRHQDHPDDSIENSKHDRQARAQRPRVRSAAAGQVNVTHAGTSRHSGADIRSRAQSTPPGKPLNTVPRP